MKQPVLTEYPNGDKAYYLDGRLHREDGPAFVRASDGKEFWYQYGRIFRKDGAAYEQPESSFSGPSNYIKVFEEDNTRSVDLTYMSQMDKITYANYTSNAESLLKLVVDKNINVVAAIVGNPSITDKMLETASIDSSETVRRKVALHPKTPKHVLKALASDKNVEVRRSLASCAYAPIEVLAILVEDSDEGVSTLAKQNAKLNAETDILPGSSDFVATAKAKPFRSESKSTTILNQAKDLYEDTDITIEEISRRIRRSVSYVYRAANKGKWKRRKLAM